MKPRILNVLRRPASKASGAPPLLFVHGGYANAACWDINFLPFFAARGYDCHALDLSGHGTSEGGDRLDQFGLDDFADDVVQVAARLPGKPVLIGHSMGTVVIERSLEKSLAEAAVLLAPVPPSGTQGATVNLAITQPDFFSEISHVSRGDYTDNTLRVIKDVYFSPDTPLKDLIRFEGLFQSESQRAIMEMMMLAWRLPRRRPKLPVLVMGGELDTLFPPRLLDYTALPWAGDVEVVPRAGHTIMLDPHWQNAAGNILAWLRDNGF